jgi:hypothetical protein
MAAHFIFFVRLKMRIGKDGKRLVLPSQPTLPA